MKKLVGLFVVVAVVFAISTVSAAEPPTASCFDLGDGLIICPPFN
jgi:hypothetical protein